LGTAVVLGVFFALGVFLAALRLVGWPIGEVASTPQRWSLWHILRYLSDAVLVLLLIALFRPSRDSAPQRSSGLGLLRKVALAATIAALVAVVLNTTQMVYSANLQMAQRYGLLVTQGGHMEYLSRPTMPQIWLSFVVDSLPPLCRLMIPLIVYRSLAAVLHCEGFGAGSGSSQQAWEL
jgi:hypothetical protein